MPQTQMTIAQAIAAVRDRFPFQGYMESAEGAYANVARTALQMFGFACSSYDDLIYDLGRPEIESPSAHVDRIWHRRDDVKGGLLPVVQRIAKELTSAGTAFVESWASFHAQLRQNVVRSQSFDPSI